MLPFCRVMKSTAMKDALHRNHCASLIVPSAAWHIVLSSSTKSRRALYADLPMSRRCRAGTATNEPSRGLVLWRRRRDNRRLFAGRSWVLRQVLTISNRSTPISTWSNTHETTQQVKRKMSGNSTPVYALVQRPLCSRTFSNRVLTLGTINEGTRGIIFCTADLLVRKEYV